MSDWRDDDWYVLMIARALDITPQAVRDMKWDHIEEQLGEEGIYRVARGMRHRGNPIYYTREHIEDLRKRGRL